MADEEPRNDQEPTAAEQPTGADTEDTSPDTSTESSEEVDYKAQYEAMKAHSRKWESKAKANREAADKLKEIEDAGKTDLEKVTAQRDELQEVLDAQQIELERARVATAHGISVADAELFLHGDADAMKKQAEALAQRMLAKKEPENPFQGRGASSDARSAAKSWADSLFKK